MFVLQLRSLDIQGYIVRLGCKNGKPTFFLVHAKYTVGGIITQKSLLRFIVYLELMSISPSDFAYIKCRSTQFVTSVKRKISFDTFLILNRIRKIHYGNECSICSLISNVNTEKTFLNAAAFK